MYEYQSVQDCSLLCSQPWAVLYLIYVYKVFCRGSLGCFFMIKCYYYYQDDDDDDDDEDDDDYYYWLVVCSNQACVILATA